MKYKVIALIGEAGSGKDTVAKKLQSWYPGIFNLVVTATTRPPREGEIDGVDYIFMTNEEFKATPMIEKACFNNWWYGTPESSFEAYHKNIVVINPEGVRSYLNNENIDLKIYWLKTSKQERIRRQMNRESNPNIEEINRRIIADEKDFKDLSFEGKEIIQLSNETAYELTNSVVKIIEDNFG